jgi:hypothetical protein
MNVMGLLRLRTGLNKGEKRMKLLEAKVAFPFRVLFNPFLLFHRVTQKNGGNEVLCVFLLFYRLLSIRNSTAPTMAIAMMMATDTGRRYRSAIDTGVGVGSGVGEGASSTVM